MNVIPKVTRDEYDEFIVRLYFGVNGDYLKCCIDRAYLDFSRTLHGFAGLSENAAVREQAGSGLHELFAGVQSSDQAMIGNQVEFDHWHQTVCSRLAQVYARHGYQNFYVGQAQKWINMTFKYIFTLGEKRILGFGGLYPFCHAPLDNIFVELLVQKHDFQRLSCAWSRLNAYQEYLDYQNQIRQYFAPAPPLDVEFHLWAGNEFADSPQL